MKISEIFIKRVPQQNSLIGFCSFVLDDLKINNVAIHSKLSEPGIRLVFPEKNGLQCVYPITYELSDFITKQIEGVFYADIKRPVAYKP